MDLWQPAGAVIGSLITAGGAYIVGKLSSRTTAQSVDKSAQQAFTDDIIAAMSSFKADSADLFALRIEVVKLREEKAMADIREASCVQQLTNMHRQLEEKDRQIALLQVEVNRYRERKE